MTKLKIGEKLLAVRNGKKLTQADMADLLQVPPTTYARMERNEAHVELEKITAFASVLKVPLHDLLPDNLAIDNRSQNTGFGGSMVFGNQYFYLGNEAVASVMSQEIKELREANALLREQIILQKQSREDDKG